MATAAYSQNHTERIDSIIDDYERVRHDFIYGKDGSYMCITTCDTGNISSVVDEVDSNGNLVRSYKYENTYNASGTKVIVLGQRDDYTYDSQGRLITFRKYARSGRSNALGLIAEKTNTYQGDSGKPSSTDSIAYDTASYVDIRTETEYDSEGRALLIVTSSDSGSGFEKKGKTENAYSATGFLTSTTSYDYVEDDRWRINHKAEYGEDGAYAITYYGELVEGTITECNRSIFDKFGLCMDKTTNDANFTTDRDFYSDGRLKQESVKRADDDETPYARYDYEYLTMDEGADYYVVTESYYDEAEKEWSSPKSCCCIPGKVVDGVGKDYHACTESFVHCLFYVNGIETMDAVVRAGNGKVLTEEKTVSNYDNDGDLTSVEHYVASYAEGSAPELSLDYRRVYEYDASVPASDIAGYDLLGYHKKILSSYMERPAVSEPYGFAHYYHSGHQDDTTGISPLQPADAHTTAPVHDVGGRKISDTRSGRIYISKGKTFIAK